MHATRPRELLRITEAAERLNVSRASVYRWAHDGRLPAVQLGGPGSPLRIPADELDQWLFADLEAPGGPPPPSPGDRVERRASERAWSTFEEARPLAAEEGR
jgi:excisionase family DNA binding protein